MTTIATDGRTMAGDSKCGNPTFHTDVAKICRADDGALLGSCGQAFDTPGFLFWYNNGMSGSPDVTEDFEGLILQPNGEVLCVNAKGHRFVHAVPAAVGSGCPIAYGAMDAGASPEEAVRICIRRDSGTGGTVQVEYLEAALKAVA